MDSRESRPAWRLLAALVVGAILANLLFACLAGFGLYLSTAPGLAVHLVLTVLLVFVVVYFFCISPILLETQDYKRKVTQLRALAQQFEQQIGARDTELAGTARQLEAEIALRQKAESEQRHLAGELESRVLERTRQFESASQELRAQLAEKTKETENLRESEKRYRRLVEIADEGIWTISAEGRTNFMNRRGAELLGYKLPDVLGRSPQDFVVVEDLPAELRGFELHKGSTPDSLEFRMRRKDGRELWVRASLSSMFGDQGDYLGALVLFADVTPRKRQERRLQEQAALLDAAQDAIMFCEPDLRIRSWSQGARRLYGWTAEEAAGKNVLDLLADKSEPGPDPPLPGALQSDQHWDGELRQVAKDGRRLVVHARLDTIRSGSGQPGAILFLGTDVTCQKQREAEWIREQRLESASSLAGGLAHELNNTLAPIVLSAQMLRSKGGMEREDEELAATIEASALRSAELLKQALVFARGMEGDRVSVDPGRLVQEVAGIAREMLPRSIQVFSEIEENLWSVRGDRMQLRQVLLKLCVNARDAMPSGGQLRLRAKNRSIEPPAPGSPRLASGGYVSIEVQDTGPGIPASLQGKIFEPFFSTKEQGKGTGLGLSMALGIVRSHRGTIHVRSQVGTGTTFEVLLPALDSGAAPREPVPDAGVGHGELIVVVEEEAALCDVARRTLSYHGYEVLTARDGVEALGLLVQHHGRVKLVLTSLVMPSMDGPSLARAARKIDPKLRIIASSSMGRNSGQAEKLAALQTLGVSRILAKPYTTQDLLRAVREELAAAKSL